MRWASELLIKVNLIQRGNRRSANQDYAYLENEVALFFDTTFWGITFGLPDPEYGDMLINVLNHPIWDLMAPPKIELERRDILKFCRRYCHAVRQLEEI